MQDTRTEERLSAGEAAQATILGHPDITLPCLIRDFSPSGMCILAERDIPCGLIVKVDWETHFLVGRVRTVSAAGSSFRVGLELLLCSRWSGMQTFLAPEAAPSQGTAPRV